MRFRVLVERRAAVAAEVAAAHAAHLSRLDYAPWRRWVGAGQPGSDRSRRAEAAAAERAHRVRSGDWVFSRADLLRAELATLVDERGWRARRWKPVPAGVAEAPGRRWGTTTQRYDGVVHLDVDPRSGELLRRVAYWTSVRATRELRAFVDRHTRGPAAVPDLPPAAQALGLALVAARMPTDRELTERARWQRHIVTTGDILREVIYRTGQGYTPPPPR